MEAGTRFNPREIKKGDVLVLKSGSPPMTVVDDGRPPASLGLGENFRCRIIELTWFDGAGHARSGTFDRDAVEPYREPTTTN